MPSRFPGHAALPIALAVGVALIASTAAKTQQAPSAQRDFAKELANKVRGLYVVAAAGGVLLQDPVGRQSSPALQKVLRDANTAIGHLEFYQVDRDSGPTSSPIRELVKDLVDGGFDLLGLGETLGGDATLRSALGLLAQADLGVARPDRLPVFQNLPSGRAALINGPNPVRLSTAKYVTADQLAQLKAIRDSIVARRTDSDVARPIGVPDDPPNQVTIFSDTFVLGPVTGEIREEPNAQERSANLMAVRHTKQYADYIAFSMPMPPTPKSEHNATAQRPHPSVVSLAHDLVDNGMDMYVGYGNHVVQGVEVYKGRPIFYNLGDLGAHRTDSSSSRRTALVATATYQDGILNEVRLYPVDLGVNTMERPASTLGVPMTPSPQLAGQILAEVQRASEAFGTRIAIENGVGVIRVPRDATLPIGQGISDFGTFPRGGPGGGRGGRGGGRGGGL